MHGGWSTHSHPEVSFHLCYPTIYRHTPISQVPQLMSSSRTLRCSCSHLVALLQVSSSQLIESASQSYQYPQCNCLTQAINNPMQVPYPSYKEENDTRCRHKKQARYSSRQ
jgi:hypothetical protein